MKSFVCLIASVALVGNAAARVWGPMPTYHNHGMAVGQSEISIDVPKPEQRNPDQCEVYEHVDYMEHGCEQHCIVDGAFGRIRIQEGRPRMVSTCKPASSFCRVPVIVHPDMNVTMTNGRCNADCQCEPHQFEDDVTLGLQSVVASLISSRHHSGHRHHRLQEGRNEFGVVKLRIPAPTERNDSACEDYETPHFVFGVAQELQCRQVCTITGNIGGLQFEGAPRIIKGNVPDGSYCELRTGGQGKIQLSGVDQLLQGVCRKGVCQPISWSPSAETKPLLNSFTSDKVQFESIINRKQGNNIDEMNSIEMGSQSGSSSSSEEYFA